MAPPHLFRVILPVSDIEAAASFYARLLEMPGTRVSSGRHYFDCGEDAAHARAEEAGCGERTGIEVRPWGERSFYARDPFENPICFVDSHTLFTGERAWAGTPHTT